MAIRVWLPEAWMVLLFDVSRAPSGDLAATGVAYSRDGVAAGFLAHISESGQLVRAVRTAPFTGERVTFAPSGSVWLLGHNTNQGTHGILQKYGSDGQFQQEILPRTSFPGSTVHPALNTGDGAPFIAATDKTVWMFSVVTNEWIESSIDGSSVHRWPIKPPLGGKPGSVAGSIGRTGRLTGLAKTADGKVFASFIVQSGNSLYRLERTLGVWLPVALSPGNEDFGWLLGSDGTNLVYRATGDGIVRWAHPQ